MVRGLFLLFTLFLLSVCSSKAPDRSDANRRDPKVKAIKGPRGETSWGDAALNLIPARSGIASTSEAQIKTQFAECHFGSVSTASRLGDCPADKMIPERPAGLDKLQIQILPGGDAAPAMRLVACCSKDSPQPLKGQLVIRAERLCPEVTLVASQSAHVYRVSAPGKRDFVQAEISYGTDDKKVVGHTILLTPSEVGSECSDIVAADKALNTEFGTPSAP
jgi:hypothetical protein